MATISSPAESLTRQFCTLAEYRKITGRSPASALRDIKSGRVPHVRIGHALLIPTSFFADLEQAAYSVKAAE